MAQTVTAQLRYLKIHPRKVRFVVDLVRGLPVNEAESRLMLSPRRPGAQILKVLRSAVANAVNNFKLDAGKLYIQSIFVDQGPKQRRWTPRARGSASTIEKKTSHVTVILGVYDEAKASKYTILPKPKKKEEAKGGAKKKHDDADHEKHATTAEKAAPETPKAGFMKRTFRRKSI
jgi:large subunit ribosomal protein L22